MRMLQSQPSLEFGKLEPISPVVSTEFELDEEEEARIVSMLTREANARFLDMHMSMAPSPSPNPGGTPSPNPEPAPSAPVPSPIASPSPTSVPEASRPPSACPYAAVGTVDSIVEFRKFVDVAAGLVDNAQHS